MKGTHTADSSSICFTCPLLIAVVRFLRTKLEAVVCRLREVRAASIHWVLSVRAAVADIGSPPTLDAAAPTGSEARPGDGVAVTE
jgi:hypothetical protein